ncbi:hypothetical protein, partial [Carbonactinospora thermoautotrophica]|uniref:hypothetical protein n=1 Tax=Carbonactinospora thermoautotrophica TaxID=1469144 RepID=UPI0039F74128
VVAGRPGSGKTTVALGTAARYGAALLAGDRVICHPDLARGTWQVIGLPLAWRIAPGTARSVPTLAHALAAGLNPRRGEALVDGKYELTGAETAGLFGVPVLPVAALGRVVVLEHAPGQAVSVTELAPDDRMPALAETLFHPDDQLFTTDWLGVHPPLTGAAVAERAARLAQTVPVYRVTWPEPAALAVLPDLLVGLPAGLTQ